MMRPEPSAGLFITDTICTLEACSQHYFPPHRDLFESIKESDLTGIQLKGVRLSEFYCIHTSKYNQENLPWQAKCEVLNDNAGWLCNASAWGSCIATIITFLALFDILISMWLHHQQDPSHTTKYVGNHCTTKTSSQRLGNTVIHKRHFLEWKLNYEIFGDWSETQIHQLRCCRIWCTIVGTCFVMCNLT